MRNIRKCLREDACKVLMQGMVIAHINYANALYAGLPKVTTETTAASVTLQLPSKRISTECLKTLDWLLVQQRVHFKILTLIFKCLHETAPTYLKELIERKSPSRSGLRSGNSVDGLVELHPKYWNDLPNHIKQATSLDNFERRSEDPLI